MQDVQPCGCRVCSLRIAPHEPANLDRTAHDGHLQDSKRRARLKLADRPTVHTPALMFALPTRR